MSELHEDIPVEAKVTEWLSKMGWTLQSAEELKPQRGIHSSTKCYYVLCTHHHSL